MKGTRRVIICGFCSKVWHYTITYAKDSGWIFLPSWRGESVNCWFCSDECEARQKSAWNGDYLRAFHPTQAKIRDTLVSFQNQVKLMGRQ